MITTRKRSGSNSKRPKEKIINFYELLFRNEEFQNKEDEFWNEEFFLCSPNQEHLESEIMKISSNLEQTVAIRKNLNLLITQCINTLDCGELDIVLIELADGQSYFFRFPENGKRIRNSFHTLCIIFYTIFKKLPETGFEFLNSIFTSTELEEKMRTLIYRCNMFLTSTLNNVNKDSS